MRRQTDISRGLRGNKGSTIVTVLVMVALVSFMGAILLFMTYTGFLMKKTEREGISNFYDAETAVNEIRAGVQLAVSDAIAKANTEVLEHYNAAAADESKMTFKNEFLDALYAWKRTPDANQLLRLDTIPEVDLPNGNYYDASMLKTEFITAAMQSDVQVYTDVSDTYGRVSIAADMSTVTLENLTLRYLKDGYESYVTTDITILVPDFTYTLTNLMTTAIQDYVIVADTALEQASGGNLTVQGNIYAGRVDVSGLGNQMTVAPGSILNSHFITDGAITLSAASQLSISDKVSLWARRLDIDNGAKAYLNGEAYIADDLSLGENAAAVLSGRYYGFGYSATDAAKSSSIVINGRNTELTIGTELKTLMLAGNCFIGPPTGADNNNIITGESVSAKSNQLAYLIPPECLSTVTTNPVIYNGAVPDANTLKAYVNTNVDLWGTDSSLSDYRAGAQLVYRPFTSSNQTLVYFYMKFSTPEDARRYFIDYFSHNSDKIEKYMKLYSKTLAINNAVNSMISGNTVYLDAAGDVTLSEATTADFINAAALLQTRFDNLRVTLTPNSAGTTGTTVYSNMVSKTAVDGLTDEKTLFYNEDGSGSLNVVGMISKTSVAITDVLSAYPNVKVVVCEGNITVNSTFNGLLLAKGTVTLLSSVSLDRDGVTAALQATRAPDDTLLDYLLIGPSSEPNIQLNTVTWDLKTLVSYSGWSKH